MAERFLLPLTLLAVMSVMYLATAGAASIAWSGGTISSGRGGDGDILRKGGPWARSDWRAAEGGTKHDRTTQRAWSGGAPKQIGTANDLADDSRRCSSRPCSSSASSSSLPEAWHVRSGGAKATAPSSLTKAFRRMRDGAKATPSRSFQEAFRMRGGGAKVAPPPSSQGTVPGGTSSSSEKPAWSALGPITRQKAADAAGTGSRAGKEGDGQGQGEGQQEFAPQFLDFQSRVGFMKKVYLTVSVQLVYTGLVCALMRGYRDPILQLLFGHGKVPQILFFISTIATIFGTNAIMWANVEVRQNFPRNLPLLTAFTTAWALYVGVFSLMFTQGSVLRAVFQAAFIVGSLTAYAFRTNPKHELTQLGAGLYSAGNALGMFCLMKLFFFRGHRASDLALSCFATLFFSLYLVYDTYRIIGGKHRQSGMFSVKDWAVAAMALYEDIMQIFIHLLALFGEAQR